VPVKADELQALLVSRAAHESGLHPVTLRKWMKAGKIQAICGLGFLGDSLACDPTNDRK
jgi:hypothetical protein